MTVRVRYAPSPTGHLHIGGVRTALFNYLFALHHGGQFILRFEDTDVERNVPGAEEEMLRGFRWLGFEWAEGPDVGGASGPYRCMERLPLYQEHLAKLQAHGAAYPCFCTAAELQAERDAAIRDGRMAGYSGKCRHLSETDRQAKIAAGVEHSYRFAIPVDTVIALTDLIRGVVRFEGNDIGDFVIVKSNGVPTYNFQVVVDDALMGITHVIRGEEHLSNTPRQLLLYEALGYTPPAFGHLPQVLNHDRKKLSKRDPNVKPVHAYRSDGYLPEAIVNFLALLGWSPVGEEELLPFAELIRQFNLDRVNRSGAIFDVDKLRWVANQYVKHAPLAQVTALVKEQLAKANWLVPDGVAEEWLAAVVALFQEKMSAAVDFLQLAQTFFVETVAYEDEAQALLREAAAQAVVRRYAELTAADEAWTAEASKSRFKRIQQEMGVKGRDLFMPVRAAVTGAVHGPDLQQAIALLPRDWVLRRLAAAIATAV